MVTLLQSTALRAKSSLADESPA